MIALDIVRNAILKYVDVDATKVAPHTTLDELEIDSLTLADLLFEFEDRIGTSMNNPEQRPQTVQNLIDIVEPYLIKADQLKAA